jgi:hypothetical protein
MDVINDDEALSLALSRDIPESVRRILALRRHLIDLATFITVAPGDSLAEVERMAGIPITVGIVDGSHYDEPGYAPPWEWVMDHGGAYEAPIITSDDGSGIVLIVEDSEGVDPTLLTLLRAHRIPAPVEDDDAVA